MRTVHIVSHRGSSRLARVIPSMHVHLCVVWWLFSSPVSFSSPFRCSSSRLSRCLPPSSTRSSSPKTCATSAWGPWPVLTTRHPSQIMHRVVLDFSLCLLASCRLCFPSLLPAGCLTLSVCLSACHALRDVLVACLGELVARVQHAHSRAARIHVVILLWQTACVWMRPGVVWVASASGCTSQPKLSHLNS